MPKLDGSAKHSDFLTPYDAHEQIVRQPHTHSPEKGYQPKPAAAPKAVAPAPAKAGQ